MSPLITLGLALGVVFATSTAILLLWWYVTKSILKPLMMQDKYIDMMVEAEVSNLFLIATRGALSLPGLFINAFFSTIGLIFDNLFWFLVLLILTSGALVWNETNDSVAKAYLVVRICYLQDIVNFFILPTADIVVMLYNSIIGVFDFAINMRSMAEFVIPITLFKCALKEAVGNLLFYVADTFYAFFFDLNHWVANGATTGEWNIMLTLRSFGFVVDCLLPILNCFCNILNPLFEGVSLLANELSVHYFVNCLFNTIVRLFQVVTVTLKYFVSYILPGYNPVKPDFTNATNTACCALYNGGDALEDAIFIVVEFIWGFLDMPLPPELRQFLSINYASILTHPLCGVARVINMTAVAFVNMNDDPNGFLEPNGHGIQYLQFGFVADEFKYGARKLGEPFYIFNPAARAVVAQFALGVVDIAAFLAEWVIGNVWFAIWSNPDDVEPLYPAPLLSGIYRYINFLFYYFPNYWAKAPPGGDPMTQGTYVFSSSLAQLYTDAFIFAVSVGDLLGLLNNPLGCAAEHLIKTLVCAISVLCNLVSFFMTILTAQEDMATNGRAVNTTAFFIEARYASDCLGTLVSQFGNCTVTPNDQHKNFFCCLGEVITSFLDAVISLLEQVVHFIQDILTLPTTAVELCLFGAYNPSREECMRIPSLVDPINRLDNALCALGCAIAGIVPMTILFTDLNCIFPPGPPVEEVDQNDPNAGIGDIFLDFIGDLTGSGPDLAVKQCNAIPSCIGNVICQILLIVTVPFRIFDLFVTQLIVGNPLANLFDFLNTSATMIARQVGRAADSLGILADCVFCAFFNDGVDCSTVFYTLMHYVFVIPLVGLAGSFGFMSFYIGRIVMSGIKDMFNGQGFFGLYSIITKLFKLFGIYGEAANFWFTRVFSGIGLYLTGSFFTSISHGLCPMLEAQITTMVAEIIALSSIPITTIHMCCEGSFACIPLLVKREDQQDYSSAGTTVPPVVNGSIILTPDTWLKYVVTHFDSVLQWPSTDTCHDSMIQYQHTAWNVLTNDERAHANFCIYKILWANRTDNQPNISSSTCDDMFSPEENIDWRTLRPFEKSFINNCIKSRIYVDSIRKKADIPWFPQDWSTNENRKLHFGIELVSAARIYYQYMMDRNTAPSIMITASYAEAWASMGLNTSHYMGLATTDDVLLMRSHYHLEDYFKWNNNATQFKPIVWITTGFWTFVGSFSDRVVQTSSAFSDNVTDPREYLPYTYHTDVPGGVSDGLLFDLVSRIFSGISTFAKRWADPVNLKKRATFFVEARQMGSKVSNAVSREATRMSLEWWKTASNDISAYYGEGELNETKELMYEYESAIRGLDPAHGKHSIVYQLGEWWHNFELPTVKEVPPQRDGKYRARASDFNATSNETTLERFSRYVSLLRKGSQGANNRVGSLMSGLYVLRNRLYMMVIKQRIEEIQTKHYKSEEQLKASFKKEEGDNNTVTYRVSTRSPVLIPSPEQIKDENETLFYRETMKTIDEEERLGRRLLLDRVYTTNAMVRMSSLLDMVCTSSSALLCAKCYVADVFLGRIENGLRITMNYYEGGQYDANLAETMDLFAYSFNESAPVRIGDSDELPIRWPWPMYDNLRILGDNTPNKLRFSDLISLSDGVMTDFGLSVENSTFYNDIDYSTVDGVVSSFIFKYFLPVIKFFYNLILFLFSPTGVSDATTSISFLIQSWVVCDWNIGSAFTGTHKRFSIGEMLFYYIAIYLLIMIIGITVKISFWGLLTATGFAGTIFLFTYLNVTYNWAWLCWPGLPYQLLQDVNYFLHHTLLTKCDWFLSGLIRDVYNNYNCHSCNFILNTTISKCKDEGFSDIFGHIVFMMEFYAPWIIQWLRDTTTPLYIFYQIPFINQRLNQFANLDMTDPQVYALHWTCNVTMNSISNLIIVAFFFLMIKFAMPTLNIVTSIFTIVASILFSIFSLVYKVLQSFFIMTQLYPFVITGFTEISIPGSEENDTGEMMQRANTYSSSPFNSDNTMMMMTQRPHPYYNTPSNFNYYQDRETQYQEQQQPPLRRRKVVSGPQEYDLQRNSLRSALYKAFDHTKKSYLAHSKTR